MIPKLVFLNSLLLLWGSGGCLLAQQANSTNRQLSLAQAHDMIVTGNDKQGKAILAIKDLYDKANDQQKDELTKQMSSWIISLIDAPVAKGEQWISGTSTRSAACALAGVLKLEAAVPSLIRLLSPLPGQRDNNGYNKTAVFKDGYMVEGPSVYALIEIGQPAIAPLKAELDASDKSWLSLLAAYKVKQEPSGDEAHALHNEERKRACIRYIIEQIDLKAQHPQ